MLICLFMFMSALPLTALISNAQEETTTLIAASDFQPKEGADKGIAVVDDIISAIKKDGITKADGFLFCGDYDFGTFGNSEETKEGIGKLTESVSELVDEKDMVFVQGNHDAVPGTAGLNVSGNNDPANGKYGVFVINNDDYMWYNKDETKIMRTAQKLINYLNDKLAQGYDKPIFVLSHLPLHYNMRTVLDGDGKYATYLFEALNAAGEKGLNIIFLFGHDHSNGWDDYLGGSSIYLPKGENILIADKSQTEFKSHTLNFTYMNAGYVGYYDEHNKGVDGTLTMTSFRIMPGGSVIITRYDREGLHNLKAAGVSNAYKEEIAYAPNTNVYASRQTLTLTKVTDKAPIKDLMKLNNAGRRYNRVNSVDDLKDGGRYLLVYNSDTDQIVEPKVVEKSNAGGTRVGFELRKVYGFGDSDAYGNYAALEWTLHLTGTKWLLGVNDKYVAFTQTEDKAITATLENAGSFFDIAGEAAYTFTSGEFMFNYNARGLINAYTSDPASFYIYEYVGYTVDVTGGSATVDGNAVTYADVGTNVTLTADAAPEGMYFEKWVVEGGDITLEADSVTTFAMPEKAVKVSAVYTDKDPNAQPPTGNDGETDDSKKDGDFPIVPVVIVAASVAIIAITAVVVIKRKKK